MHLDSLCIEVTRKCNMKCAHCLRGGAQRVNMSNEVIYAALKLFDSATTTTFTGGEPSLNVEAIETFYQQSLWSDKDFGCFYIVTNGRQYSQRLVDICNKMYYDRGKYDNECSGLAVSRDVYHSEFATSRTDNAWYAYRELPYYCSGKENKYRWGVIAEGRAKDWGGRDNKEEVEGNNTYFICKNQIEGVLYVNALGDVVLGCDFSYTTQKKLKIGNVLLNTREEIFSQIPLSENYDEEEGFPEYYKK